MLIGIAVSAAVIGALLLWLYAASAGNDNVRLRRLFEAASYELEDISALHERLRTTKIAAEIEGIMLEQKSLIYDLQDALDDPDGRIASALIMKHRAKIA